mmetsp:Transcript_83346/g.162185  ORF Transcript_83346/g.162185 Transcript_83346/m.162185 type:complete len:142 (+) Transcript_83346:572-997(+)
MFEVIVSISPLGGVFMMQLFGHKPNLPCVQGAKDRQCAVTAAVRKQLMEEVLPKHLTHLEAILAASPTGWLAGTSGPTVADFQIAPRICWAIHENDGVDPSLLDKFPKVMALVKRVYGLETVRDYYRARGKSFDNNNMKLA